MTPASIRNIKLLAVCCGAVFAGWLAKQAGFRNTVPPPLAPAHMTPRISPAAISALLETDRTMACGALADALADADSTQLPGIAAMISEHPAFGARAWRALFACWMKEDPQAAWQFALQHPEPIDNIHLSGIALEQWAATDPQAARKVVATPTAEQSVMLIRGMMKSDIEGAFRLLDETRAAGIMLEGDPFRSDDYCYSKDNRLMELARIHPSAAVARAEADEEYVLGPVLLGWLDRNPADAGTWLAEHPDREEILFHAAGIMSGIGAGYHPQVMDLIMTTLPPGNQKYEVVQQALEDLARENPELALQEATRLLADPAAHAEAVGKIASIVAEKDFTKAWDMLGQLDNSHQDIRRVDLPAIEVSDQGAATELHVPCSYAWSLTSMRGLVSPAEIKSRMLAEMILVDKDQALHAMDQLPADQVIAVAGECVERWVDRDPAEAVAWLARKLGDKGDLDSVRGWMHNLDAHQSSLTELVNSLPQGTVRNALAMDAAGEMVVGDPRAALQFVRDMSPAPEAVAAVYGAWAALDPMAALDHLSGDAGAPPDAWADVIEDCDKFPEEVERAVDALPPGKARDTAITAVVKLTLAAADPLSAAEWAIDIGGETTRRKALESVFTRAGLDLRLTGDDDFANSLCELISTSDHIPEAEKSRWLERADREFNQP